jgi:membrane-associated phospholipid phosphatase
VSSVALTKAQALDEALARALVTRRVAVLNGPAAWFSNVGRGGLSWLALLALARASGRIERTAQLAGSGAAILASYGGSLLLARALGRTRPCRNGVTPLIECPDGPSLPSDQVAGAFAAAVVVGTALPRLRRPLLALATALAAARVYVGVHYPADVAAGAALGAATGALAAGARGRPGRRVGQRPLSAAAGGRGIMSAHRPPHEPS